MSSFKKFYKENRKKAIQSQKNSLKLLQLLMILCSYNFIKFSMCSYNFNVAVRISINPVIIFITVIVVVTGADCSIIVIVHGQIILSVG